MKGRVIRGALYLLFGGLPALLVSFYAGMVLPDMIRLGLHDVEVWIRTVAFGLALWISAGLAGTLSCWFVIFGAGSRSPRWRTLHAFLLSGGIAAACLFAASGAEMFGIAPAIVGVALLAELRLAQRSQPPGDVRIANSSER